MNNNTGYFVVTRQNSDRKEYLFHLHGVAPEQVVWIQNHKEATGFSESEAKNMVKQYGGTILKFMF